MDKERAGKALEGSQMEMNKKEVPACPSEGRVFFTSDTH